MTIQLYTVYEDVDLPLDVVLSGDTGYNAQNRRVARLVLMRWPDGRPCHLINLWLMQESLKTQARDTVRVYASQLTHLVRYCHTYRIEFFDFDDEHFFTFTKHLKAIKKSNAITDNEFVGDNHIRAIQQRCLYFLVWLSNKFSYLSEVKLADSEDDNAKLTVEYKTNPYNGKKEISHRYVLSTTPDLDDKGVITEEAIQAIFDAIFKAHDISNLPQRALTKLKANKEKFTAKNNYIYERRLFCIKTLKLTGLRPEELVDIPLNDNLSVLTKRFILIPTKKQGYPAPLRKFEINVRSALDFQRYLSQREIFIKFLSSQDPAYNAPDSLLLNDDGHFLKKESLTKEFTRLCKSADLQNVRSCLSMFRHRFITREMHLAMLLRFERNPELRQSWTPAFKEQVCIIVMKKTGHRHPKSLYTYFDDEHRLLNSDPGRQDRFDSIERLSSARDSLIDLRYQSRLSGDQLATEQIDLIEKNINELYRKLLGDNSSD